MTAALPPTVRLSPTEAHANRGLPAWQRVLDRTELTTDGCLRWTGPVGGNRYVTTTDNGRTTSAHRAVYTALVGTIPDGMTLDHACHTRAYAAGTCTGGATCQHRRCMAPWHLVPMPIRDNVLLGGSLGAIHARKAVCDQGHPFSETNTYVSPNGRQRTCRICQRKRKREHRDRNLERIREQDRESKRAKAERNPELVREQRRARTVRDRLARAQAAA